MKQATQKPSGRPKGSKDASPRSRRTKSEIAAAQSEQDRLLADLVPVIEPEAVKAPVIEPEAVKAPVIEPEAVKAPVIEPEAVKAPVIEPEEPLLHVALLPGSLGSVLGDSSETRKVPAWFRRR